MDKPLKNDIVRLTPPQGSYNGAYPEVWPVRKNGTLYELEYGTDFRVSTSCDPDNKIASLDYKGDYPLIRKEFVKQHKHKFKLITRENED